MLDEPLGALDRGLREQLLQELRQLLLHSGIPAIYVTHDQEEAFALADRVVLLHEGRVEQSGTPEQVYRHPQTPWVARFLGLTNLLEGVLESDQPVVVRTALGLFREGGDKKCGLPIGSPVMLLLRPDSARRVADGAGENILTGTAANCAFTGAGYRLTLRVGGAQTFLFEMQDMYAVGKVVHLALQPQQVELIP
jgi:ABC-type Fe3+/spermidine/putrescine transport system ATPase subunit